MASTISHLVSPSIQLASSASPSSLLRRSTTGSSYLSVSRSIRCQAGAADGDERVGVDRRNLLLGLGGAATATTLYGLTPPAFADPIVTPELKTCVPATLPSGALYPPECCPPFGKGTVKDYVLPSVTKLRVRTAAHLYSKENIAKYEEATRLMKALDKDDPRSFSQQAKVHCAYCDSAYDQVGFPGKEIQVHFCSLFQPFHRWYIYFYEKILGKLIGDPDFAMPFWNWDHPDGMAMPAIFTQNPASPLYNPNRNPLHMPPVLIDFEDSSKEYSDEEQIEANLCYLYKMLVSGAKTPELFFGKKYIGGTDPKPGQGNIESIHNTPHKWVGNPANPNGEDMGAYYSAGKDALFYCHHVNVDRMWDIWLKLPGGLRKNIRAPDWLESSFILYDEEANPVRVFVKDSLDSAKLGYKYQDVDIPWANKKPQKSTAVPAVEFKVLKEPTFPLVLKSPITATVKRPVKSRSAAEKAAVEEVLVIDGIKIDSKFSARLDVYINAPDVQSLGPGPAEFAGSFTNIPHKLKGKKQEEPPTKLRFGISEVLDTLEADGDDTITVTLVPRQGRNKITVGGIGIELTSE